MVLTALWLVLFVSLVLWLAYQRASLVKATLAFGVLLVYYTLFGTGPTWWKAALWALYVPHALLNMRPLRRALISNRFLLVYRRMLPPMSDTEREALEAGTVWWDGELFTGGPGLGQAALGQGAGAHGRGAGVHRRALRRAVPDDQRLRHHAPARGPAARGLGLHQEEGLLGDDHPQEVRRPRVLGVRALLRRREDREPLEHGRLDGVCRTRSVPPNSCCTTAPKSSASITCRGSRAARRSPASALTGPRVGSDAASIPDTGIVCRGAYQGREIDRHPPAISPSATSRSRRSRRSSASPSACSIPTGCWAATRPTTASRCALVPRDTPGITIGRRHFPLNGPFQNGPIQGTRRVRAARRDHRRAGDGRPGLAHAGRAALGRPLHLAAVDRDRRRKGARVLDRRLRAHPPPVQPAGRHASRASRR